MPAKKINGGRPLKLRADPLAKVRNARKAAEKASKGARGLGRQKRDKNGRFA